MDEHTESKQKKTPEKRKWNVKIIALAICCSLLGGIVGGGAVLLAGHHFTEKSVSELIEDSMELAAKRSAFRYPHNFRLSIAVSCVSHKNY